MAEDGQPMDSVTLLDANGRVLYTNTNRSFRYTLPAHGLSLGVCVISVRKAGRTLSQVVIR